MCIKFVKNTAIFRAKTPNVRILHIILALRHVLRFKTTEKSLNFPTKNMLRPEFKHEANLHVSFVNIIKNSKETRIR